MVDGNPSLAAEYYFLRCPRGGTTTYSATSARRCKTVNDRLKTRLVDNLIRLDAADGRFNARNPGIPRLCGPKGRMRVAIGIFWTGRAACRGVDRQDMGQGKGGYVQEDLVGSQFIKIRQN